MNLDTYNDVFKNLFGVSEQDLNAEFNFGVAPGWDSLGHMELIARLEDEFSIMLETDDITHFGGYENGKKILAKYGIEI